MSATAQDQIIKSSLSPIFLSRNPADADRMYLPGNPLNPPRIPLNVEQRILGVANQVGVTIAAGAFPTTEQPTVEIEVANTQNPDRISMTTGYKFAQGSASVPYVRTFKAKAASTVLANAAGRVGFGAAADIDGAKLWRVDTKTGSNHEFLSRVAAATGPADNTQWALDANLQVDVDAADATAQSVLRLYVPGLVDANATSMIKASVGDLTYIQPFILFPSYTLMTVVISRVGVIPGELLSGSDETVNLNFQVFGDSFDSGSGIDVHFSDASLIYPELVN